MTSRLVDLAREAGDRALRVLAIGAHPDDIEIGCGGTLLRLAAEAPETEFRLLVISAVGERREEAERSAATLLAGCRVTTELGRFRDAFLPYEGAAVKDHLERSAKPFAPDLVLTHRTDDRHQDHRLVAETTWQTFRDRPILEYEIPKYEGDLGSSNLLVMLTDDQARQKVEHVMQAFPSQAGRHWFTPDTFFALLRLRGIETGGRSRYAEAFKASKLVV
jgi:LmbE family N-acetylglucosaminyl deacetylase